MSADSHVSFLKMTPKICPTPSPPSPFSLLIRSLILARNHWILGLKNFFHHENQFCNWTLPTKKQKLETKEGDGIIDPTVGKKEYYHIIKITITSNLIRIFLGIEFGVEIFICCSTTLLTKWLTCQMLSLTVLHQQISVRMDLYLLIQYISVLVLLCSFEYTIS